MTPRAKFDALRAKYLLARDKFDEYERRMRRRYGSEFVPYWGTAVEQKTIDKLRAAKDRGGRALFDHIQAVSPRDWSYGAPVRWLYEDLIWEDAVRPVGEKLSVVPPLAYGATSPRT